MRRGSWHQFGDRSQKLAEELLGRGIGCGVIFSPRDLSFQKARDYAEAYRGCGAEVLVDQQFYVPRFSNRKLESYPISEYRLAVSALTRLGDRETAGLANCLELVNNALATDAVIAPAVTYESGRNDITDLNAWLFHLSKAVGDRLGIPTYATVVLGQSTTTSELALAKALSHATSLNADGWYYAFEFSPERIPSDIETVLRCCQAGLTLACTGRPVLHAYAGPLALLSHGFGVTGAAIGHSQNLWKFTRERWADPSDQGGGGDAPPRFFSASLWGTIIYPDEMARLSADIRAEVNTVSDYSSPVSSNLRWGRWDANKHLVTIISNTVNSISSNTDPRVCAGIAAEYLERATELHGRIAASGTILRDSTNVYQSNWLRSIQRLLLESAPDYDYLSLLG